MFVSVMQEQFHKALKDVSYALERKPTLPVLGNVLLQTDNNSRLVIAATNLELSITAYIGAKVNQPGAITLPHATLKKFIESCPSYRVDIQRDTATESARLLCDTTRTDLKGIPAVEFPPVPDEREPAFMVAAEELKAALAAVVDTCEKPKKDSWVNPVKTGVLMRIRGDEVTLLAMNLSSMSQRTITIERTFDTDQDYVIPAPSVRALIKIIGNDKTFVGVVLPSVRPLMQFAIRNVAISTQLIDNKFPDTDSIDTSGHMGQATFYASDFLRAVTQAERMATAEIFGAPTGDRSPSWYTAATPGVTLTFKPSNDPLCADTLIVSGASVDGLNSTECNIDASEMTTRFDESFHPVRTLRIATAVLLNAIESLAQTGALGKLTIRFSVRRGDKPISLYKESDPDSAVIFMPMSGESPSWSQLRPSKTRSAISVRAGVTKPSKGKQKQSRKSDDDLTIPRRTLAELTVANAPAPLATPSVTTESPAPQSAPMTIRELKQEFSDNPYMSHLFNKAQIASGVMTASDSRTPTGMRAIKTFIGGNQGVVQRGGWRIEIKLVGRRFNLRGTPIT